jgi:hypothetical protein
MAPLTPFQMDPEKRRAAPAGTTGPRDLRIVMPLLAALFWNQGAVEVAIRRSHCRDAGLFRGERISGSPLRGPRRR